jgi:hypothetical protein
MLDEKDTRSSVDSNFSLCFAYTYSQLFIFFPSRSSIAVEVLRLSFHNPQIRRSVDPYQVRNAAPLSPDTFSLYVRFVDSV